MKLLTQSQLAKLTRNGERSQREPDFDPHPVVKLFRRMRNAPGY